MAVSGFELFVSDNANIEEETGIFVLHSIIIGKGNAMFGGHAEPALEKNTTLKYNTFE
jgi:phosphoenolpyruvate carboxylase